MILPNKLFKRNLEFTASENQTLKTILSYFRVSVICIFNVYDFNIELNENVSLFEIYLILCDIF